MSSNGIKDRVAIVGMSCTPFREHFDESRDDLLIDAADEVLASVGVTKQDIDAYWMGMAISGSSGIVLASALKLQGKPVTRVENYCATGSEALRQAAYAVASGAYDIAMAIGCDKFKDTGFAGTNASLPPNDGTARTLTAAAMYSMILPGLCQEVRRRPSRAAVCGWPRSPRRTIETVPATRWRSFARRRRRRTSARWPPSPASSRSSTAPAWPTAPPPPSSFGPRTPIATRTSPCSSRACRLSPATAPVSSTRTTTSPRSPRWSSPPRTRTSRRASTTPAPRLPWQKSTTASHRPSSC